MTADTAGAAPPMALTGEIEAAAANVAAGPWPDRLRRMADELSMTRAVGGFALGVCIGASEYPLDTYDTLWVTAGLSATDYADGRLARLATARDGRRSKLGAWADQITDKIFVGAMLGGVAVGSFMNNRPEIGVAAATANAVFITRDILVTRWRRQAEASDADINTGAQWPGKIKTATQMTALGALVSPLMESRAVGWAAVGLLGVSVAMSVYSAVKYHRYFKRAMDTQPVV